MSAYVIHVGHACTTHVKSLKLASSILLIYTVYVYIGVLVVSIAAYSIYPTL